MLKNAVIKVNCICTCSAICKSCPDVFHKGTYRHNRPGHTWQPGTMFTALAEPCKEAWLLCSTAEPTSLGEILTLCSSLSCELTQSALSPVPLGNTTFKKLHILVKHYIGILTQARAEPIYLRYNSVSLSTFYFPMYSVSIRQESSSEDLPLLYSLRIIKSTMHALNHKPDKGRNLLYPSNSRQELLVLWSLTDIFLTCSIKPLTG